MTRRKREMVGLTNERDSELVAQAYDLLGFALLTLGEPDRTRSADDRIAELQLENSRLRRLVTDLLLGKVKLEEAAQSQRSVA